MSSNPRKLSQFWQELKRRKVIKVIAMYAGVAYILIELANNVTEPLHLPDWIPTFVILLLVIGFPITIILAWIFDVTPEGVAKTRHVDEQETDHPQVIDAGRKNRMNWGKVLNWSISGILMIVVLTYVVINYIDFSDPVLVRKLSVQLPQGDYLGSTPAGSTVAISPDGTKLVYVAEREGNSYLFLRPLDEFEATVIPGTEGATAVFFSPDSRWVAFYSGGNLQRVALSGGAPLIICEAKFGHGGTWCEDNTIIFSDTHNSSLLRVPVEGGTPEILTSALKYAREESEASHVYPYVLPGGKAILYTISQGADEERIVAYSLETGERSTLIEPGGNAQYMSTGHILYSWKGDLLAVRFNLNKMQVIGQPFLIQSGLNSSAYFNALYNISNEGSLAFVPGEYAESVNRLFLVDHEGVAEPLDFQATIYQSPRFSPDGKQLLITSIEENANLWIYGMERGTSRRFTEKELNSFWGIWSNDGKDIVFNSNLHGGTELNLYRQKADGRGDPVRMSNSLYHQLPKCFSKDGKLLVYVEGIHPETGVDISMLQTGGDSIPIPLFHDRFNQSFPLISPDNKWIAYVSDESGRDEVFVSSFPELERTAQISTDGGTEPLWAPDGTSIYFRDFSGDKLMKVTFATDPQLALGEPVLHLQGNYKGSSGRWGRNYDLSPDGTHFLMIKEENVESVANQIYVILNLSKDYFE